MDTFITLQARTLLLTPACAAGHLPPNALLQVLLYQGQPEACNPEKLPTYQHYSGKKQLGLPNKVFHIFQPVAAALLQRACSGSFQRRR